MNIADQLGLKKLKVLQLLVREKNVSVVASQVGLTQQAVSDQLRKLREIFDDPLFVRKANGLIPTPMAERLYEKIDRILGDLEDLAEPDVFDPSTTTGTYVIAATDYAQIVVLPSVLERVRKDAPNLNITIRDIDGPRVFDSMRRGQVDLLIAFPDFIPAGLPSVILFSEHYLCVAPKGCRLLEGELTAEELARYPQIAASPSRPDYRESIDAWFEDQGYSRNIVITAPCFSLVPDYMLRTDSLAFLPARSVDTGKLGVIDLKDAPSGFDVMAAWHARTANDPLHNWMLDLVQAQGRMFDCR